MSSVHPKCRVYFQKLMNKPGGSTFEPKTKDNVVVPIIRVDPIPETTHVEP